MEKKVLQVSFELEHDTEVLKQFISQNPLGFSVCSDGMVIKLHDNYFYLLSLFQHSILLERLQQGSINGAVYVDSFEAMTTVVFVGYPPDFKNTCKLLHACLQLQHSFTSYQALSFNASTCTLVDNNLSCIFYSH